MVLDQEFDAVALKAGLSTLVDEHEIYRIKGFVAVPGKSMRLVIHGVGKRFDSFYDRPWNTAEPRQTRLVVIGDSLDASTIRQAVAALA